jgi:hypothetical protein
MLRWWNYFDLFLNCLLLRPTYAFVRSGLKAAISGWTMLTLSYKIWLLYAGFETWDFYTIFVEDSGSSGMLHCVASSLMQVFGPTIPWRWRCCAPSKCWDVLNYPVHSVTSQKTRLLKDFYQQGLMIYRSVS